MHIVVTDILTCPVCGPTHGLILRADRIADRRVEAGAFGCPNCRRQYPIHEGVAGLFVDGDDTTAGDDASTAGADADDALRIAALLGLTESSGFALIMGPAARNAAAVSALADGFEIIADARHADPAAGVSRVRIGTQVPLFGERLRGVWLSGGSADALLEESARVLHPLGRIVLEPAPGDAETRLASAGLRVVARKGSTLLAAR
jgi:uncharacterized protein YbaR (Trm112 family)